MRNHSTHTWKTAIAKLLVAVMVMLSVTVVPSVTTKAASTPTLTKSSKNIFIGNTYNLNVVNKVKNSTYVWTSSDKKVATVDKRGIVEGLKKGTATITCKVTTTDNTYDLTCKVTVIYPAVVFRIKNKATSLNVGQKYDLDRYIPSISNDKTTWTSSDTSIAAPDKNGKFVALKEGKVTITGKTLSGKSDSVTITVLGKEGIVTTQEELNAALNGGIELITIRTDAKVDLNIPKGVYSKAKLVVEAPNADIHNAGVFASIDIKKIAANSWYENAVGNLLNILAADSRIVVGANASVKIEVSESGAKLRIENNGVVEEIKIDKPSDIDISGTSKDDIPVVINVPNITITTSVPLNMDCKEKVELVLQKGAEDTKISAASEAVIPTIKGSITISVSVGTGDNKKVQEVKPTPMPTATPTAVPSTGGPSTPAATPTPTVAPVTVTEDGSWVSYKLSKSLTELSSVSVAYKGQNYTVSGAVLDRLVFFLSMSQVDATKTLWNSIDTTGLTSTKDGQTVKVSGTAGSTKTVAFTGGSLTGKSYVVTLNSDSTITVESNQTGDSFTLQKVNEDTLKISGIAKADLTFTATFK